VSERVKVAVLMFVNSPILSGKLATEQFFLAGTALTRAPTADSEPRMLTPL
jgi:hypothetical protein